MNRLETIQAVEPLAPWLGGKKHLARTIIERIDAVPHQCYAEPFVGMGGVFLRRTTRPKSEIINDLNGEIVNLFRIVREHPEELARQFRWVLTSRQEFVRWIAVDPDTLTDVQRAARFTYLQRLSFGGKPAHEAGPGQIALSVDRPARLTAQRMFQLIEAAHLRLQRVHIERLNWDAFLLRYDRTSTLLYLDPPYWNHEKDYGKGIFAREDFTRMAELLGSLNGRFILSLNDRPEVRELFCGFRIETVQTRYSANAKHTRQVNQLLISN